MKALRLDSHYHHIFWPPWAEALLVIAVFMLYFPPHVERFISPSAYVEPVAAPPAAPAFTVNQVEHFFAQKIGAAPQRFGETAVFSQPVSVGDADDFEVAITPEENGAMAMEFRGSGDSALGLARDFFGSSFFQTEETVALLSMLDRMHGSPIEHLPRFDVSMNLVELIDTLRLTVRFGPSVTPTN